MAGILATGRAPAYAQPTTVHWLRWNDFVPASDQLLRRELLPEAEKALGIKINFETVNANDLQPRITSAIQSGAGPDLIMLDQQPPAALRRRASSTSATSPRTSARRRAATTSLATGNLQRRQDGSSHAVGHHRRHDRLPQIVVRRGRRHQVPRDLGGVSRGRQEAQGQGPPDRPDARPHLRRRAGLHLSATCGRGAARRSRPTASVVHQQQGDDRVGQVHDRRSGRTRTTRAASPGTTPTTTAPSCRRPSRRR